MITRTLYSTKHSLAASISGAEPTRKVLLLAAELNNVATCLYERDRFDDAQDLYTQSLQVMKGLLEDNNAGYEVLENLGRCKKKLEALTRELVHSSRRYQEPRFYQALPVQLEQANDEEIVSTTVLFNLALVQMKQATQGKATALLKMAASALPNNAFSTGGPNAQLCMSIYYHLGLAYHEQGKEDEAMHTFIHALQVGKATLSSSHLLVAYILNKIGCILFEQGYISEAMDAFDEASCNLDRQLIKIVNEERKKRVSENPAAAA